MAERRMFAKTIIDSDAFLEMPLSTQALYFHLSMRADDEGFINNPKKIQRMIGAADDDLKVLIAKNFVIPFESGIVVIKHWKIHNYIRGDRLHATKYQDEKTMLETKENGAYTLNLNEVDISKVTDICQTSDSQMSDTLDTEIRLGKVRLGKDSINSIKDTVRPTEIVGRIVEKWNALSDVGIKSITKINEGTQRHQWLSARLKQYCEEDFLKAINNIRNSTFLQGHNKNGWVITFDWFIRPNNFPKVLEGNYNDKKGGANGSIETADSKDADPIENQRAYDAKYKGTVYEV